MATLMELPILSWKNWQGKEKARNVPVLNYHLGMISFRLGEKAEARQYLHLATDSKQPFPGRDEAETLLGELR